MGFSKQEYWSGLLYPSPGNLPDPGVEPGSPTLLVDALPSEPPGKPPVVKNLPANAGGIRDAGSIPGLGRCPGVGHGNPLQYSCLENPMNRGAWRAKVHGVGLQRGRHDCSELACIGAFSHHSLKASILQCSAFFMVQLSHQYMTTEKTITD